MKVSKKRGKTQSGPTDANLSRFIKQYEKEIAQRKKGSGQCRVVELDDVPKGKLSFLPEGSIAIFVAEQKSPNLETLHATLRSGDYNAFRETLGGNLKRLSRLISAREPFHKGSVKNAPVLGEVSYSGKTLSRAFMVSEALPVSFAFLPYLGGKLDHKQFALTQYSKASQGMEALIILRKPDLTKVEQDILKQIPADQATLQIGDPGIYGHCIIAATLTVAAVAATVYVTYKVYEQMREERERDRQQDQQDRQAAQADNQAANQADNQANQADNQADQQANQADNQQDDQQDNQDESGQGDDQEDNGSSRFYHDLTDLAYEFGADRIDVAATATELLKLRTQYVKNFV